jgi:hypothetical protein
VLADRVPSEGPRWDMSPPFNGVRQIQATSLLPHLFSELSGTTNDR